MADPICTVEYCDRRAVKRGWCRPHYLRWWRYGDPLKGRGSVKPLIEPRCAVDGCELPTDSRGLCSAHYQRLMRLGDAGGAEVQPRNKDAICSVQDCGRRHYAFGWCDLHYQRVRRNGNPDDVFVGNWKGDEAGYSAVHERLNRTRGKASGFPCAHCGKPAVDWAYDNADPNPKFGVRHGYRLAYSTDPERYLPLCRLCHSKHDENVPKVRVDD